MIWPEPTLESLYKAYPRKTQKKQALAAFAKALDRIAAGEVDGKPWMPEDAIQYLRERVEEARASMGSREAKWIPHPATWANQSRYLRREVNAELPPDLEQCIEILAIYPKMPAADAIHANLASFSRSLMAISKAQKEKPENTWQRLAERVAEFSFHVSRWPAADLQFVPNPERFFNERRYEWPAAAWCRASSNNWQSERDQVRRVLER